MAYYHPCNGCVVDKDNCARRSAIRSAISGLSVTSVKFICHERTAKFQKGERVSFPWATCVGQDYNGDDVWEMHTFNGTIICEAKRPSLFTVRVDLTGDSYTADPADVFRSKSGVVNVKASTITRLEEPPKPFCETCLKYRGEEGRCHADLNQGIWMYIPEECMDHSAGKH